jgi:hypothetical protein
MVAEYTRTRAISKALNNRLVETLSRSVLDEGGKKLGILRGDTLMLESEDEIAILMDLCIYNVRRQGLNAVERFLEKSPPPEDSDEMRILQGMRKAWYSLFQVTQVFPGRGVEASDILYERTTFIMDVSFSQSVVPGAMLATRVVPLKDFTMTGGAALPIPDAAALTAIQRQAAEVVKRCHITTLQGLTAEQDAELTATIIRGCLQEGAASMIAYEDPGAQRRSTP